MAVKQHIREKMATILRHINNKEIEIQSSRITQKVINHEKFKNAKYISIYLSFGQEVKTDELVKYIFQEKKHCFIPRFKFGASEMEMVKLESYDDFLSLPVNKWNIRQPADDKSRVNVFDEGKLDLVLVPGLAFTHQGHRLGRGKGYYDRFFQKCATSLKQPPYIIGLALQEQILEDLPVTENDFSMNEIISS